MTPANVRHVRARRNAAGLAGRDRRGIILSDPPPGPVMLRHLPLVCALGLAPAALAGQYHTPDSARVVTSDIDHFWRAYDRAARARTERDTLRAYFEEYYLPASPGLRDFISSRIGSVYDLVRVIRSHPGFYRSIRPATARVAHNAAVIPELFHRWAQLYPDAVFPDVYFLIGRLSSGGTTSADKILIGAEMRSWTPAAPDSELSPWLRSVLRGPDSIAAIVAHELIHVNQRGDEDAQTLLSAVIREGSADFLGELISGANINAGLDRWARPRAAELWREFKRDMHGTDYSHWLYQGQGAGDRPADLGYWMGYQITKAYYDRAGDKAAAIGRILDITDWDGFLAASGYGRQFDSP
jgi:Predicted Zn-dependent protease (DUF2268)